MDQLETHQNNWRLMRRVGAGVALVCYTPKQLATDKGGQWVGGGSGLAVLSWRTVDVLGIFLIF